MTASYRGAESGPIVDYAFGILANVAQGEHTRWSIVYDLKRLEIRFRTWHSGGAPEADRGEHSYGQA